MKLVKCNNGHFYDSESFSNCPHCTSGGAGNDNVTVPIHQSGNDDVTVALTTPPPTPAGASQGGSLQDVVNAAVNSSSPAVVQDDNKTVGFFSSSIGKEPVVGWLVCVKGEHFGEDFRLKSGRNFIGRSNDMDVSITKDNTVSRERHAIVVYEPRGNIFLMQPGDSKELCYLNDNVVLSPQPLAAHDKILVGKTELMFVPCCTSSFSWETKED